MTGLIKRTCFILFLSFLICLSATFTAYTEILKFEIVPTVLFVKENGALKQVLQANINYKGDTKPGTIKVRVGKDNFAYNLDKVVSGENKFFINITELKKPSKGTFALAIGNEKANFSLNVKPQRKWTIYLFHHSHSDIGYTDLQTRIEERHVAYLDSVIKYCKETDNYPDDAKFRWNVEITWSLMNYMERRPESKFKELMDLVKQGRMEVGAWQLQMSDGFSHETLIRNLYFSKELSRKYGIDVQCAMNNDVNGFSWATPMVLSQSGVKYFDTGVNETRSFAPLDRPCAFYWESPDGSRILHWNGEHYLFSNYDLSMHEAQSVCLPKVTTYLSKLQEKPDYPYDITAINIGGWITDNCPPGRNLSDKIKEWNEKWAYPKLRLALMKDFFTDLETRYAKDIPVYKLAWPDYWTDGVASTSYETGINRITHTELANAEKICSIGSILDKSFAYPAKEIRKAYDLSMLYDEHTWGAYNSISEPYSELAKSQWAVKSTYAYIPSEKSRAELSTGLADIAENIPCKSDFSFAVFNPLSQEKTDIVKISLPVKLRDKKTDFRIIDSRTGKEIGYKKIDDYNISLMASSIPPMGYAVYNIKTGEKPAAVIPPESKGKDCIENSFYKVILDSKTGAVKSIFDKELGTELVDQSSKYKLNQLIYERPDSGAAAVNNMVKRWNFKFFTPEIAAISTGTTVPYTSSIVSKSSTFRFPSIEQQVILYDDVKRIDFVNILDKEETLDAEALYFAFPFNSDKGSFRFEIADATMAPETEQLPKTTRDWYAVQNWVEISNPSYSILWSPLEAPLVEFCDINTGKWQKKLDITNSTIFSYAMNNYWFTNFKASQGGKFTFRYSITSRKGGSDRTASTLAGLDFTTSLKTVWLSDLRSGTLPPDTGSFIKIDKPNVTLQAFKLAENGNGYILRFRELSGKDTNVAADFPLFGTNINYIICDPTEKDTGITVKGPLRFTIKAFSIQTVRVNF